MKQITLLFIFTLYLSNVFKAQVYNDITSFVNAAGSASAGDVIQLADGVYNDNFVLDVTNSGTAANPITIKSENGGGAVLSGTIGFNISGDYIRFEGFQIEDATIDPNQNPNGAGISGLLFNVMGDFCVLQDLFFKNVETGVHTNQRVVYLGTNSVSDTIRRCWFEKGIQHGMFIMGAISANDPKHATIEECYFTAQRPPGSPNGGSAIRIGGGGVNYSPDGSSVIQNNLFEEQNGENEVISLKSSNNYIQHNTFLNCNGSINFRHYPDNVMTDNFFINDGTVTMPDGGVAGIWGDGHTVKNNYFHQVISRDNDGGAISLMAGTGAPITSQHEQVQNCIIKDNIIYEADPADNAIAFGVRYSSTRNFMPTNVTVEGNLIYSSSSQDQIGYTNSGVTNVTYTNNEIYTVAGSMVPTGQNVNPNLVPDAYGVYRAGNKGPSGNPLNCTQVGPIWYQCNGQVIVDADGDGEPNTTDCDDNDPALNNLDLDNDGVSSCAGDCDDNDPLMHTLDVDGDGVSSCDGDCDDNDATLNNLDTDNDGVTTCDGDCDDSDPAMNNLDSDNDGVTTCDGDCDDNDPALNNLDYDGDGETSCDGDCDDNDPNVNNLDVDGDGVSLCDGDCNDTDGDIYPGAVDVPDNGIDEDCSGADSTIINGVEEQLNNGRIRIYPNPAKEVLNLDFNEMASFKIIDNLGRVLYRGERVLNTTLIIESLAVGVYYIMVDGVESTQYYFIKQ